ncbi:hypothetical protein CDAR_569721 [Caerostris darwini]|uniref:Uncharacterized protein n=1 Tax=Caerostris darwini TaxID=1538125 RepID=A0AAV4RY57_9ARAC|nr:hypothetical protein CDAR_569721 [Caerostris darwini]
MHIRWIDIGSCGEKCQKANTIYPFMDGYKLAEEALLSRKWFRGTLWVNLLLMNDNMDRFKNISNLSDHICRLLFIIVRHGRIFRAIWNCMSKEHEGDFVILPGLKPCRRSIVPLLCRYSTSPTTDKLQSQSPELSIPVKPSLSLSKFV